MCFMGMLSYEVECCGILMTKPIHGAIKLYPDIKSWIKHIIIGLKTNPSYEQHLAQISKTNMKKIKDMTAPSLRFISICFWNGKIYEINLSEVITLHHGEKLLQWKNHTLF